MRWQVSFRVGDSERRPSRFTSPRLGGGRPCTCRVGLFLEVLPVTNNFEKLVLVLLQPLAGVHKKEQRTSHSLLRAGGAAAPAGTLIETTHVYTTQPGA
jgi:hypothetical protein